jgi:hypothetical protein
MKAFAKNAMAALTLTASGVVMADENSFRLKPGPEAEQVRAMCSICHSADYIQMNSPFLDRAGWEAVVTKMVKVMGAPIPEADVPRIVDYLTRNYGAREIVD